MLLHLGDIVFGLVKGMHLQCIHHNTTRVQPGYHVFQVG